VIADSSIGEGGARAAEPLWFQTPEERARYLEEAIEHNSQLPTMQFWTDQVERLRRLGHEGVTKLDLRPGRPKRPQKGHEFVCVMNGALQKLEQQVGHAAAWTLIAILGHDDFHMPTGVLETTNDELAESVRRAPRNVKPHTKKLVQKGLLQRLDRGWRVSPWAMWLVTGEQQRDPTGMPPRRTKASKIADERRRLGDGTITSSVTKPSPDGDGTITRSVSKPSPRNERGHAPTRGVTDDHHVSLDVVV
jgi:hypothetical protein